MSDSSKTINELFNERLHVAPIKPGESVQFKMLNAGRKEEGRDKPSAPDDVWLAGEERVFDKFSKRMIHMQNVIGIRYNQPAKGMEKQQLLDIGKLKFKKGFLTLTEQDNETYCFMMRSNKNKSNKFRDRRVTPLYELVSYKKDVEDSLQIEDMRDRAIDLIRGADWTTLKAAAQKLNQSQDATVHISNINDLQGMKLELRQKAKSHAKQVIVAMDDPRQKKVVVVYEAMQFNLLVNEGNEWFISRKDRLDPIFTSEPDKEQIESLVTFFENEDKGKSAYVEIAKALKEIYSVKAAA